MPPSRASTIPACSASASTLSVTPSSVAGNADGITLSRSTASRQAGETPRSRPSTASFTLAGTSPGAAASASATKNGLPRVNANTASPSRPVPFTSRTTASRDRGESSSRCTGSPASTPSSRCSGCPAASASSRTVSTSIAPSEPTRRAA